jgi:hypothetical protein
MISDKDINDKIKDIYDGNNSLDILLEFEEVLDNLHVYAYQNWYDGEVISGPEISRYWVEIELMYPYKKMPDPEGAVRLLKHGCHVYYKKDDLEINVDIESPDDLEMDSKGKRRPKTKTVKIWVVKIIIPRQLIDDFNSEKITVNGVDIDMEDINDAYAEELDNVMDKEDNQDEQF